MQALFCKHSDGLVLRWCSKHGAWEHPDRFRGQHRSCDGYLFQSTPCTVVDTTMNVDGTAAEPPSNPSTTLEATAVAAAAVTASVLPPQIPKINPAWRKQMDTSTGEYSEYAVDQVRSLYGDGVEAFMKFVTGDRDGACDEAAIRGALEVFVQRGVGGVPRGSSAVADVSTAPLAPSTCAKCGQPTAAAGFVGKSLCLLCVAGGKCGLALVDVNHALVTGHIRGKGKHSACAGFSM